MGYLIALIVLFVIIGSTLIGLEGPKEATYTGIGMIILAFILTMIVIFTVIFHVKTNPISSGYSSSTNVSRSEYEWHGRVCNSHNSCFDVYLKPLNPYQGQVE